MNNKYSVACITLDRDKYTLQFVRRCYGLRGIYGRFDSKIRFEIESDGRFDSRFDLNAKKNDSQLPTKQYNLALVTGQ